MKTPEDFRHAAWQPARLLPRWVRVLHFRLASALPMAVNSRPSASSAEKVRLWHQGNELNEPVDRRLTGVKLTHPKRLQYLCS